MAPGHDEMFHVIIHGAEMNQISRGSPYHRDRVRKSPIRYQRQLNSPPACKWDAFAQIKEYKLCYNPKMWIEMGWIGIETKDNAGGFQQLNQFIGSSYLAEHETNT
jgi:hypothetical protein